MRDHNSTSQGDKQPPGDRMLPVMAMSDLTPTEKNLLAVLAWHDGPGGCFPSIDTLADSTNANRYQVSDHIKSLEDKGRIRRQRWRSTNRYTIFYDNPTVGDFPTVKENLTVGKSPVLTVGNFPTQTRMEPEELENPSTKQRESSVLPTVPNGSTKRFFFRKKREDETWDEYHHDIEPIIKERIGEAPTGWEWPQYIQKYKQSFN